MAEQLISALMFKHFIVYAPMLKKIEDPLHNPVVLILSVIMFWRGIWLLLDTRFFPGEPKFSHLMSLGIVILYVGILNLTRNLNR